MRPATRACWLWGTSVLLSLAASAPLLAQVGAPERGGGLEIQPVTGVYGHLMEGRFQQPTSVYWDRWQRELFIVDRGGPRIAIANERGFPTFSFGTARYLSSPRAVVTDRQGRVYVADSGYEGIRIFDYDGTVLPDLDLSGVPAAERPLYPVALAVSDDEVLHFLDGLNRRIVIVGIDGSGARTIVAPGTDAELMRSPVDLDLAPDGKIVVADATGLAVQVYDAAGAFVKGWGAHEVGASNFSLPSGVAVDEEGRVFVADSLRQDIKVFTSEGEFLTNFGGLGTAPGQVLYPEDVISDRQGRVIVAERVGRRVQVFQVSRIVRSGARGAAVGALPQGGS